MRPGRGWPTGVRRPPTAAGSRPRPIRRRRGRSARRRRRPRSRRAGSCRTQRGRVRGDQAVLHREEAPGLRGPVRERTQGEVVAGREGQRTAGDRPSDQVGRVAGRLGPRTLREKVDDAGRGPRRRRRRGRGDAPGSSRARTEEGERDSRQTSTRGAGPPRVSTALPAWPSGRAMSRSTPSIRCGRRPNGWLRSCQRCHASRSRGWVRPSTVPPGLGRGARRCAPRGSLRARRRARGRPRSGRSRPGGPVPRPSGEPMTAAPPPARRGATRQPGRRLAVPRPRRPRTRAAGRRDAPTSPVGPTARWTPRVQGAPPHDWGIARR